MMIKLLVLNGPNLNLLGLREPKLYGTRSYDELCAMIRAHAERRGIAVEIVQTNHEGVMVDRIQEARGVFDGIVLNPAAYPHTSVALRDCLLAVGIPTVEVHLTDPASREPFRAVSYVRDACLATICGHGFDGYPEAMDLLLHTLTKC